MIRELRIYIPWSAHVCWDIRGDFSWRLLCSFALLAAPSLKGGFHTLICLHHSPYTRGSNGENGHLFFFLSSNLCIKILTCLLYFFFSFFPTGQIFFALHLKPKQHLRLLTHLQKKKRGGRTRIKLDDGDDDDECFPPPPSGPPSYHYTTPLHHIPLNKPLFPPPIKK